MDLGKLIELMHGARDRYRTLEAEIRESTDESLLGESWRRASARRVPGSSAVISFGPAEGTGGSPEPRTTEAFAHIWIEGPTRWRSEERGPNPWLSIRSGDAAWGGRPDQLEDLEYPDTNTQPHEELWDPALLIAELWLDPADETTFLGRDAVNVLGRPRPTERPGGEHFLLLEEADRYRLVVDRELGIVLRLESLIRDEPLQVVELVELIVDQGFREELFAAPAR